jgi:hypothetical protein
LSPGVPGGGSGSFNLKNIYIQFIRKFKFYLNYTFFVLSANQEGQERWNSKEHFDKKWKYISSMINFLHNNNMENL